MDKDKVLEIVKQKGPLLPVHISKEINQNIMISSAILGELVSQKKIKFSHTKLGGSPLYYVDGQELKLQQLYNHLQDTEKKAYDLLKKKKILRDKTLEPAFRVALRQIKDFALPLEVTLNNNLEIFWKWYVTPIDEIKPILNEIIQKLMPVEQEVKKEVKKPLKPEIEKEKKEDIVPIQAKPESTLREELRQELLKELKEELKKEILLQKPIDQKDKKKIEKERKKKELEEKDIFLVKIKKYCEQKNIKIINYEILKKKNEIDLFISIPSAVGNINYYCKAKNKKRISDNDLSSAFLKGNQKKMPVLFLTTGTLIKKTEEKLDDEFKGISFKKINNT